MSDYRNARPYTCALFDAVQSGDISPHAVVDMALMFMSEQDVKEMIEANELTNFLMGVSDEQV